MTVERRSNFLVLGGDFDPKFALFYFGIVAEKVSKLG